MTAVFVLDDSLTARVYNSLCNSPAFIRTIQKFSIYYFCNNFQALNLILVTSAELAGLRAILKQTLMNSSGKELFLSLYPSWCHSAMATITLCFLAQVWFCFCIRRYPDIVTTIFKNHFFFYKIEKN